MKNHLFNIHHKIKLQLDAICQEAGDMNVEEFVEVYKYLQTNNESIDESIDDKKIILMQSKRINELLEFDNIELKNAIKLAHERIEEFKSGKTILIYKDTIREQQARIKELEEQIQSMLDNYGN